MKKKYLFIFLFVFVVNLSANNVVPKQGNPPPYPGPRGQELKGEKVYTVQKGDTLWDICANKLNNPWDWIKVWERNPHIDNPNWIYPKDKITLDLTKPIKDAYVSKSEDRIKDKRIKGVFKFKEDKEPAKKSEETAGKPLPQSDNIYEKSTKMEISKKEVVKEKQASENILESMRFQAGFIHENNLNNYGKIVKSEDDDLITLRNFIYIDMGHNKKYKEGQQLIIFSFGKSVEHPVTYEDMGKMVNSSGTALIKNVSKNLIKAKVNNQFNDIRVGDFVVPEYPQINLSKEKIKPDYTGYIVYLEDGKSIAGLNEYVYIDLGIKQGIRSGMHFNVLTGKDKVKGSKGIKEVPSELKGELKIINARKNVSTAVITSIRKNYKIKSGDIIKAK